MAIGNATARALTFRPREERLYFYPGQRQWYSPFAGGSSEFMNNGERVLDDRIIFHYYATGITPAMARAKVGTGSAYEIGAHDSEGRYSTAARHTRSRCQPDTGEGFLVFRGVRQPDPICA